MAKRKVKKATNRIQSGRHEHNMFIIILAGGFLVMVILFTLMGNFSSLLPSKSAQSGLQQDAFANTARADREIVIQGGAFVPADITVQIGQTVMFKNMDETEYTVTADDGTFETGPLLTGESSTVTFDTEGTYTYRSDDSSTMSGTVTVVANDTEN